jgi:hypothetical protein
MTQQELFEGPMFLCHGLRIGFRANRESVFEQLDAVLPPGWRPIEPTVPDFRYSFELGGEGQFSKAYLGPEEVIRAQSLEKVLSATASHIEHTVAKHARSSTFIHAGVIGWRGRAILFPGRSWTGKTTLVRALLRLGATYFSDEFAVVDSKGLVHPFARPLSLRIASGRIALHPDQIGAELGTHPLIAGAVVVTRYAPTGVWQPVPLSRGRAILELLRHTVAVRSNPAPSIERIKHLVHSSIAIRSTRGDADTAALLILRSIDNFTKHKEISNGNINAIRSYRAARS